MTADPPLLAGAAHDTVACVLPAVAVTPVGAPGAVAGVTAVEGEDALLVPRLLVAVTVKVYAVPLASPVTVHDVVVDVQVSPSGEDVTV